MEPASDSLFVPQEELQEDPQEEPQEPPQKRMRRTPVLTMKEVRQSVMIGLNKAEMGKIPSSHRGKLASNPASKGKGRKKSKANDLDIATLGGSDIIRDAQANSGLSAVPTSTDGNKDKALKELVGSLPEDVRSEARPDKKLVLDATRKFKHKPKTDKEGGWKHSKLLTSLYHHQILGAAFMRERETMNKEPSGGMLCDVMGLGKTLQTLANIVDGEDEKLDDNAQTTLIVAPRGVIDHWISQIAKHVRPRVLGPILSYYAGSRMESTDAVESMLFHKIIITSYDEVRNSYPKLVKSDDMTPEATQRWAEKEFKDKAGPLHQIRFRRIILDEGHQIRNPGSQTSIAVRALHAHYKWILSGTPLLNHNAEFWAYFNFLGVPKVGSFHSFLQNFCSGDEQANQRLTNVVRSILFRRTHRTKLFACPIITLPEIEEQTVVVKPLAIEKALYKMITDVFIDGMNSMASSNDQEAQNRCFLTLILKLRMLNSHLLSVQDILKKMLADDANLAKLEKALPENIDDTTDCSRAIFSLIKDLVMAGKNAKRPMEASPAKPLNRKFHALIRELMSNDNQEESQTRMKCAGCDTLSAQTRVTSCMHLVCEDCFQDIQESNSAGENDAKIVCPSCTDKDKVNTEPFGMDPSILSVKLGFLGVTNSEKGRKTKSKKSDKSLFMRLFEDDDEDFDPNDMDWIAIAGQEMPSSKIIQTRELIEKWLAEDPTTKIVIFTQFRATAAIFSGMCKKKSWGHTMLTGDMSFGSRQQSIDDFQTNAEFPVMIASLKAGGIGLDLTSGNKCILVEPWWNDAIQQQAFCRLFRIGQSRNVEIVKLVSAETIDGYMMDLQKAKLQEIEGAIGDARLPLGQIYGRLMESFGRVQMNEGGPGYTIQPNEGE